MHWIHFSLNLSTYRTDVLTSESLPGLTMRKTALVFAITNPFASYMKWKSSKEVLAAARSANDRKIKGNLDRLITLGCDFLALSFEATGGTRTSSKSPPSNEASTHRHDDLSIACSVPIYQVAISGAVNRMVFIDVDHKLLLTLVVRADDGGGDDWDTKGVLSEHLKGGMVKICSLSSPGHSSKLQLWVDCCREEAL